MLPKEIVDIIMRYACTGQILRTCKRYYMMRDYIWGKNLNKLLSTLSQANDYEDFRNILINIGVTDIPSYPEVGIDITSRKILVGDVSFSLSISIYLGTIVCFIDAPDRYTLLLIF